MGIGAGITLRWIGHRRKSKQVSQKVCLFFIHSLLLCFFVRFLSPLPLHSALRFGSAACTLLQLELQLELQLLPPPAAFRMSLSISLTLWPAFCSPLILIVHSSYLKRSAALGAVRLSRSSPCAKILPARRRQCRRYRQQQQQQQSTLFDKHPTWHVPRISLNMLVSAGSEKILSRSSLTTLPAICAPASFQ